MNHVCVALSPPGLFSTYWLKDFSWVFLTAESLLKTTGLRSFSVALRRRSARSSSALFCWAQTPICFQSGEVGMYCVNVSTSIRMIRTLSYFFGHSRNLHSDKIKEKTDAINNKMYNLVNFALKTCNPKDIKMSN